MLANWFIGVTWLVGLTLIIAFRVKREEEMMANRFGKQYLIYMKHTGRFMPPVKLPKYLIKIRRQQTKL